MGTYRLYTSGGRGDRGGLPCGGLRLTYPDPDYPECPESFRELVEKLLDRNLFVRKNGDGSAITDSPRNRCLEFIKHLVKWENSNNPDYVEPARKLIAAAHEFLHSDANGAAPTVLDPFAGGGAIPLEALRLGCEADAIDLNPVADLIQLSTLFYAQKYGQPNSRPVPDYIKRVIAHNRTRKKAKGKGRPLFEQHAEKTRLTYEEFTPDVEITEAEYCRNPLAAEVKYWGHWVAERVRGEVAGFYPTDANNGVPVAYLWARTVQCPNPGCAATIPLYRQLWLCKKKKKQLALRFLPEPSNRQCRFDVVNGTEIDFDPSQGTMRQGQVSCPFCSTAADSKYLQRECRSGRMNQQLMSVVTTTPKGNGRTYRLCNDFDMEVFGNAAEALKQAERTNGVQLLPQEDISKQQPRVMFVTIYGLTKWCDIFNARQALTISTFVNAIREAARQVRAIDESFFEAVGTHLALVLDWVHRQVNHIDSMAQLRREDFRHI